MESGDRRSHRGDSRKPPHNDTVSISGGQEVHRAHAQQQAPTGGVDNNRSVITAQEDRTIVGVAIAVTTVGGVGIQVGFNATAQQFAAGGSGTDDARSPIIAERYQQPEEGQLPPGSLNIEWQAGEEVSVHTRNNTGASEDFSVTIYYTED